MRIDGFTLGELIHTGRMGQVYAVAAGAPIPAVIKLPQVRAGDDLENLIAYEVESMVLPALGGPHVPRFVAAGELTRTPYLVLERIPGECLQIRIGGGERRLQKPISFAFRCRDFTSLKKNIA